MSHMLHVWNTCLHLGHLGWYIVVNGAYMENWYNLTNIVLTIFRSFWGICWIFKKQRKLSECKDPNPGPTGSNHWYLQIYYTTIWWFFLSGLNKIHFSTFYSGDTCDTLPTLGHFQRTARGSAGTPAMPGTLVCSTCKEKKSRQNEPGWWFGTWLLFSIICWEFHHPNWRTPSFFRGVGWNHQPETGMVSIHTVFHDFYRATLLWWLVKTTWRGGDCHMFFCPPCSRMEWFFPTLDDLTRKYLGKPRLRLVWYLFLCIFAIEGDI